MNDRRRRLIAMIHCAKRDLGLDEDAYRATLVRVGGAGSCSGMGIEGLERVVEDFKRKGFTPRVGSAQRKLSKKPQVRKIYALWGHLKKLGVLHSPNDVALRAFTKNLTEVDNPEWLTPAQANKVIESLKTWVARVEREQATHA